jgi:hypothetical protein
MFRILWVPSDCSSLINADVSHKRSSDKYTGGATVWLEGLGQLKNPATSSGIELATSRLAA